MLDCDRYYNKRKELRGKKEVVSVVEKYKYFYRLLKIMYKYSVYDFIRGCCLILFLVLK